MALQLRRATRISALSSHALHVSAIIAAGGRGSRFGAAQPKQFLSLGGRSILERSVDAFRNCDVIDDLVVAVPADLAENPPASLRAGGKPIQIVAGGARRQDSVANAFARVVDRADIVVIHDAARPLVTDDLIRRTVAAAAESGAAIAAIARARHGEAGRRAIGVITATLPREEIFLAQTPQAFRIVGAARRAGARERCAPTKRCWPSRPGTRSRSWKAIRAT